MNVEEEEKKYFTKKKSLCLKVLNAKICSVDKNYALRIFSKVINQL